MPRQVGDNDGFAILAPQQLSMGSRWATGGLARGDGRASGSDVAA